MNNDKTTEAVARAIEQTQAMLRPQSRTSHPCYAVELLTFNPDTHEQTWVEIFSSDDPGEASEFCQNYVALAAIKAHLECLMEPSEEMIAAGQATTPGKRGHMWEYGLTNTDLKTAFQAMLSAQEKSS